MRVFPMKLSDFRKLMFLLLFLSFKILIYPFANASNGIGLGITQAIIGDKVRLSYDFSNFSKKFSLSYSDFHPNIRVSELKIRDKELASIIDISFNEGKVREKYMVFLGPSIFFGLYNNLAGGTGHVTTVGYHLGLLNNRKKEFSKLVFYVGEVKNERLYFLKFSYGIKFTLKLW